MPPKLVVTRPAAQAGHWVERLRERGVDAIAQPLIEIAAPADPAAVAAAWRGLERHAFVMFVSANAVERFAELRPPGSSWPAALEAGATGPGTAAALCAAGVPPALVVAPAADAASHDSEALWQRIAQRPWAGRRVLVVRGEEGREWLAERWRDAGAAVEFVAAYRRVLPRLDAPARARLDDALARPREHCWWFTSSQAVDHLRRLAPAADFGAACALASHPRIAARARAAGFGRVAEVAPGIESLVHAVASDERLGERTARPARRGAAPRIPRP